jgi:hypothetical protein
MKRLTGGEPNGIDTKRGDVVDFGDNTSKVA